MKSTLKNRGRIVYAPKGPKSGKGRIQLNKSPRTIRCQIRNAKGDQQILSQESPKLPTIVEHLEQAPRLDSKIKLQLFPLDDHTRLTLEKDGFHPFLELILSATKKISSVINHLHSKWGGSRVASAGELVLLSYDRQEHLASYRWTKADVDTRAYDIYRMLRSPVDFRLRYAWVSDIERKSLLPSKSAHEACLKFGDSHEDCSPGKLKGHTNVLAKEESAGLNIINRADETVDVMVSVNGLAVSTDNEMKTNCIAKQPSVLWDDSFANISIGGLLSEASLQGRLDRNDAKSREIDVCLKSSQLISDSFDAFLSGQMNCSTTQRQLANDSHFSILDAEDTCHAFAFQNCTSSSNHDLQSKSQLFSNVFEGSAPFVPTKGQDSHGSDTDLMLCSRVYNDERSLGFSGIKWTDTLGPFDLCLPSTQKVIKGESMSVTQTNL